MDTITQRIFLIRGMRVMLDADLARLYGVTTKRLIQQVLRNAQRFPADFMFQLTNGETSGLMLQFATSNLEGSGDTILIRVSKDGWRAEISKMSPD